MRTRPYRRGDFSQGIQNASTWLNRKANELFNGRNLRFNEVIGAPVRRNGYSKNGAQFSTTGKLPCGAHTAQFTSGPRKFVAVLNDASTFTLIRVQEVGGTWTTVISDIPAGVEVFFCDFGDEVFISGYTTADGIPFASRNINSVMDVSLTRNLLFCPAPKYFVVYRGVLHAANVKIGAQIFPDRIYKGSPRTGAFTFIRGDQTDTYVTPTLINQIPAMTSATAPFGVASASTEYSPDYAAWRGFDRITTDREAGMWHVGPAAVTTGWLKYDFGSGNAKVVTYYAVTGLSANALGGDLNQGPKTWTFEGSNDDIAWTSLDSRTNVPNWANSESRTYSFSNTTAYRYYRINISANQGGAYLELTELAMYTSLQGVKAMQLDLQSVRYVKPGMVIDIYKSGKPIKLYTLTVYDVDKTTNQIQYLPITRTDGTADNTTETINFPTDLSLTDFPTGTPVKFYTVGTIPGGMTADTTYYVIRIPGDDNSIKLAATYNDATIGANILLSSNGTGQLTTALSYVFSNNDEVYLTGRYTQLSTLWNVDYPTLDKSDWTAVQPGTDSSNAITGVIESTNRLFVYTLNTSNKFDGNTTIAFNKSVGCISQRTIRNIDDDWVIWTSSRGRIYARNEGSGQQEYISRGIHNELMSKIPLSQLRSAAAGIDDGEYTLYIGLFNNLPTRVIYDFGSNTWTIDSLHHKSLMYVNDSSTGFSKPYFFSDTGYSYIDDTGDLDDDQAISFEMDLGKTNYSTEAIKQFVGAYVYSHDANGLKIQIIVDDNKPITVGEIVGPAHQITYANDRKPIPNGTTVNVKIIGAINGPPQSIEAFYDHFNIVEEVTGQTDEPR